jgi:hypothetical protein
VAFYVEYRAWGKIKLTVEIEPLNTFFTEGYTFTKYLKFRKCVHFFCPTI